MSRSPLAPLLLGLLALGCGRAPAGSLKTPPASPRLRALAEHPGDQAALGDFWREVQGRAPLVEAIPGDNDNLLVTFLWRGDDPTRRVTLVGGPLIRDRRDLERLDGTDLWYVSAVVPRQARFAYGFILNDPRVYAAGRERLEEEMRRLKVVTDKLNPLADHELSLVAMPDAPPQEWITQPDRLARGAEPAEIPSKILGATRAVSTYTPIRGRPPADSWLLVVLDGQAYERHEGDGGLVPTPTILDNLATAGAIPPMVAVFVHQQDRERELSCSEPFADFLGEELVPWAQRRWGLRPDPGRVIACGSSLGGLCAAFAATRHPGAIGNVLSQSGSFFYEPGQAPGGMAPFAEPTGWLTRRLARSERLPIRFRLEVGLFECGEGHEDLITENRRLRDVLEARGYAVSYSEFMGMHDYSCWRGTLGASLIALTGTTAKGEAAKH